MWQAQVACVRLLARLLLQQEDAAELPARGLVRVVRVQQAAARQLLVWPALAFQQLVFVCHCLLLVRQHRLHARVPQYW